MWRHCLRQDDKGGLVTALAALEACLMGAGRLPVNVKVFVEGEEEIGSPGLTDLLRKHAELLAADFVISTDSGQISETQGGVLLGLRGMAAFEVEARTLATDVHSGARFQRLRAPFSACHAIKKLHVASRCVRQVYFA